MEKGLLFLTISMFCLWAILDEFFGGRKVSLVAAKLAPNSPASSIGDAIDRGMDEAAEKLPDDSLSNKLKEREKKEYGPA